MLEAFPRSKNTGSQRKWKAHEPLPAHVCEPRRTRKMRVPVIQCERIASGLPPAPIPERGLPTL